MSGIVSYNEVMDKPSKMTILWHSVAPWIPSGYGKISGNILKRFVKSGYKVIESCYYGLEPGGILNYDGIFCVSAKEGQFGVVSGAKFAQQFKVNTAFLACYSNDTEILTKSGWKDYLSLTENDEIATLDENDAIKYIKPNGIFRKHYAGKMYSLDNRAISVLVTPNHKMYVKKRTWNKFKLIPVEEIEGKRVQFKKDAKWVGVSPCSFEIGNKLYDPSKLLRLLGLYISEGHIQDNNIIITQVKPDGRARIKQILAEDGWEFKEYEHTYRIKDENLAIFFKSLGDGALNKRLPDWVLTLSPELLQSLWDTLLLGDGWITDSGSEIYCSSSKLLIDQLQEMLLKMGYSGNITINKEEGIQHILGRDKESYCHTNYAITKWVKNTPRTIPDMKSNERWTYTEEWIDYDGDVWCPMMDNIPVYVRRNGSSYWCGRTDWWAFGEFPKMMPNACLYGPMDHVNYPDEIKGFTSLYYRLVALCEFQKDMLKNQMGLKSTVIPHGVDTNLYHPMDKESVKQKHGMKGRFVFGTVNANSDKEMGGGRKSWGVMMKAMRYFLDQNPDVKDTDIAWMCHTDPSDPRGLPLISMAHKFRLDNVVKFSHPEMHKTGFSEAQMAELYNCFDIFYGTSKREGFGMCVDEDTLIETTNGVKPIKYVEKGDKVLTSSGRFEQVMAKKDRKTNGYIVKPVGLPNIITSKEHKYYINRNGLFMWANAEELELSDYLVCPIPLFDNALAETLDVTDLFPSLEHDTHYVWSKHSFDTTDGYYSKMKSLGYSKRTSETILYYINNPSKIPTDARISNILKQVRDKVTIPTNKTYPRHIILTDSMLELFGWYIAEGSVSSSMELSMGINDKSLFTCMDSLKQLGNITELTNNNSWRLCLSGILKDIFREFGTSSANKHIPLWIYGTNKCNPIVKGMLLGDGHSSNGNIIYTTKSRVLAYQLRQILLSNRINSAIRIDGRTNCYIVSIHGRNAIDLSNILNLGNWFKESKNKIRTKTNKTKIIDNFVLLPIKDITFDECDRQMFDIQVENDETFVGSGILLHNTFIEAESCGVPVIGHDFASVPELVRGHGWLCKSVAQDLNMELTPILADTAIPDVYSVAECIKDAYFNDTKREQYGKESREFALQYDWDRLHNERWIPFLEQLADDLKPKNVKQREINFDSYKPQATQRFGNLHEVMTNG